MNKIPIAAYFMVLFALLAACSLVENEEDCDPFGLDYEGSRMQPTVNFSLRYEREPNNWQPMIGYVYHFDSVWLYDENFKRIPDFFDKIPNKTPFFVKNYGDNNRFSFPEKSTPYGKDITTIYYLRLSHNDIDTIRFEYKMQKNCKKNFNYITTYYNNEKIHSLEQSNLRSLSVIKK